MLNASLILEQRRDAALEGSWFIPWNWVTHGTTPSNSPTGCKMLGCPVLSRSSSRDSDMQKSPSPSGLRGSNPKAVTTKQMLSRVSGNSRSPLDTYDAMPRAKKPEEASS